MLVESAWIGTGLLPDFVQDALEACGHRRNVEAVGQCRGKAKILVLAAVLLARRRGTKVS